MKNSGKREKTETERVHILRFIEDKFQKEGTKCALLRQKRNLYTYYPKRQVNNNLKGNPFDIQDFKFKEHCYTSTSYRYTLIEVPSSSTKEEVQEQLDKHLNGVIYRILSNHPILTDHQEYAIEQGLITKQQIAEKQLVRYWSSENKELIFDNVGKPQYRATFYSRDDLEDIDKRTEETKDYYTYYELTEEINNFVVKTPQIVL